MDMALRKEGKLVQALVREVQSGKSSAFEQLYRTHSGRIYTFGLKFFEHNRHAAEDLTKRVFVNSFEDIKNYYADITFIIWLRKFAINEIRQGEFIKSTDTHQAGAADQAIFSLPEEERIVYILHDVDKLSAEEIAEITNDSHNDIVLKLGRARKLMMDKLNVNNLEDLDYKVSFLPQKIEPEEAVWKSVFNTINKTETEEESNEKEKSSFTKKLKGFFKKGDLPLIFF